MKRLILLLSLVLTISCYAQNSKKWRGNYLLSGVVENLSVSDVTLSYSAETKKGAVSDTLKAAVADGKFSFSGFIEEPLFVTLTVGEEILIFFLDPVPLEIKIAENNKDFEIKGSPTSDDYLEIEKLRKGFQQKNEEVVSNLYHQRTFLKECELQRMSEIDLEIAQLEGQADLSPLTFAAKNKASYAVLKAMDDLLVPKGRYYTREVCSQMLRIYSQMPEDMKETLTGLNVSGKLLKAKLNMGF